MLRWGYTLVGLLYTDSAPPRPANAGSPLALSLRRPFPNILCEALGNRAVPCREQSVNLNSQCALCAHLPLSVMHARAKFPPKLRHYCADDLFDRSQRLLRDPQGDTHILHDALPLCRQHPAEGPFSQVVAVFSLRGVPQQAVP